MKTLEKVNDRFFDEIYVGFRDDGTKVTCILDENCVRYTVCIPTIRGHVKTTKRTYSNNNKALCFKNATKALNKI